MGLSNSALDAVEKALANFKSERADAEAEAGGPGAVADATDGAGAEDGAIFEVHQAAGAGAASAGPEVVEIDEGDLARPLGLEFGDPPPFPPAPGPAPGAAGAKGGREGGNRSRNRGRRHRGPPK